MLESVDIQDSEKYYGQNLKNNAKARESEDTLIYDEKNKAIPGVIWENGDVFDFLREE